MRLPRPGTRVSPTGTVVNKPKVRRDSRPHIHTQKYYRYRSSDQVHGASEKTRGHTRLLDGPVS